MWEKSSSPGEERKSWLSKLLRPNVLRAVRLLPEAVRIGNAPGGNREIHETTPREPEAGNHPVDLISQLSEELSLLKTRLEESERENRDLASRASVFEEELSRERVRLEEERGKMVSSLEAEAAAVRKKAVSEGSRKDGRRGTNRALKMPGKMRQRKPRKKSGRLSFCLNRSTGPSANILMLSVHSRCPGSSACGIPSFKHAPQRGLPRRRNGRQDAPGVLERISDKERVLVYLNPEDVDALRDGRMNSATFFGESVTSSLYRTGTWTPEAVLWRPTSEFTTPDGGSSLNRFPER